MATLTQDRLVEVEAVEVPVAVRAAGGGRR